MNCKECLRELSSLNLRYYSGTWLEGLRNPQKNLCQGSWYSITDSKQYLPLKSLEVNHYANFLNIVTYKSIVRQQLDKHVPADTDSCYITPILGNAYNSMRNNRGSIPRQRRGKHTLLITRDTCFPSESSNPSGGGVEYLHRDPASCRKRRKGRSQT
jgi:hypothetical protein